jgi:hypothetical protein
MTIDSLLKSPDVNSEVQLQIIEKLSLAITNTVYNNSKGQDILRDLQIFNPVVNYINKAIENTFEHTIFN